MSETWLAFSREDERQNYEDAYLSLEALLEVWLPKAPTDGLEILKVDNGAVDFYSLAREYYNIRDVRGHQIHKVLYHGDEEVQRWIEQVLNYDVPYMEGYYEYRSRRGLELHARPQYVGTMMGTGRIATPPPEVDPL